MNVPAIPRPLQIALLALSALATIAFLFTALARIGYPYELEFMTGACLDHVDRILDGELVYVAPSADFITWLYGPLYFYVCAGVSVVVGGSSLVVLRLVSLASAIGTTFLVIWLVRRVTKDTLAAVVAAGLWTSTYGIVGTWWDIGRVDSMFVMLATVVLALLWTGRGMKSAVAAGLLMTVAYMAKQTALLFAPPFALGLAFLDWRRAAVFAGVFAASLIPSVAVLDEIHDGWFSYYTWDVPRAHGYSLSEWWKYTTGDTLAMAPMLVASAWYVVRLFRTHRSRTALFVGAWASGIWLTAWLARAHVGGAENSVIPAHMAFSVVAALALAEAARDRTWRIPIALLVCVQFAFSAYDPRHYLPTDADRAIGDKLVEILEASEGPVMLPLHGHWARRTGHEPAAHVLAMMDVERGPDPELGQEIRAAWLAYVRDKRCDLVILNEPAANDYMQMLVDDPSKPLPDSVLENWTFEPLFEDPLDEDGQPLRQANGRLLFEPVVGLMTRPRQVWRRKR